MIPTSFLSYKGNAVYWKLRMAMTYLNFISTVSCSFSFAYPFLFGHNKSLKMQFKINRKVNKYVEEQYEAKRNHGKF